ncbi:FadR/GntR family transcriptional regulator [Sphingomonas sp. UYP23]
MQTSIVSTEISAPRRRKVKLVDEIIESLRQDIVTRRLPHGERLPSEKELSDRFGVSQPTVREAIRALETLGLVDVFHGNGTFVRSQGNYGLASALQTLVQLESVEIMEVLEVRQLLGRQSIEAAAVNATTQDIDSIAQACARFDRIDQVTKVEDITSLILDFQRAVSAASHRPLLRSLEEFMLALLNEVQVNSLGERGIRFWRARATDFQIHRVAILKGLESGDPQTALQAMNSYFQAQRSRFEKDKNMSALNLSSPGLIAVVANMVRLIKD